ncbi:hypothetical protein GS506_12910 [Rhodococcus hoagii]|nr:hypothetical protein [Prescottella equi]
MGEGTAATSDAGLAIIFATTTVDFTLTARECEGHDTTYRPTVLSPESTSVKRLELRRADYHDASGDHTETEWHVALSGDSTETLNPRDIPQVVEALQDMHALWVDRAD